MRRDRENRAERGLQPLVLAGLGRDRRLQERGKGLELRRNEKRDVLHDRPLGKTLANTLTLGQGIAHGWSWLGVNWQGMATARYERGLRQTTGAPIPAARPCSGLTEKSGRPGSSLPV